MKGDLMTRTVSTQSPSERTLDAPLFRDQIRRSTPLTRLAWLSVLAFSLALADITKGHSETANTKSTTKAASSCPSRDFPTFFDAFSKRIDLQRKFTKLPLEYGKLNADLIGTDNEDKAFERTHIYKFDKIPQDPRHGIFPTATEMAKDGTKIEIITNANSRSGKNADPETVITDSDTATVLLRAPDTGFRIYYIFKRIANCWFLYAIADRAI